MENNDKFKTKARLPWWKKHVSDWRAGTRGMSLELKGFYGECLDGQWDLQRQLPLDEKMLAMMFGCNPRSVRKLMPQLVALGKMVRTATGYYNPRMMRDILGVDALPSGGEFEPNSSPIRSEFKPNSGGIRSEFDAKVPKNPENTTREVRYQIPESETDTPKPPLGACDDKPMPSHVKPIQNWNQAFAEPEHAGVIRSETGSIQLVNGTRALWLEKFGDDAARLDAALIEISGAINDGSRKPLAADVQGRLGRILGQKLDSDRRYQSAAVARATSPETNFGRKKIDLAKLTAPGPEYVA